MRCLEKQGFLKKEQDYIQYAQNNVCHSYAVILARSAALLDLRRLGFRGMFDSPGFAMFDRVLMLNFLFLYYICNEYENLVCGKDAFHMEHTCYFLVKFLLAWFVCPNYAGDYKMANKNQKVSNGFPTSM